MPAAAPPPPAPPPLTVAAPLAGSTPRGDSEPALRRCGYPPPACRGHNRGRPAGPEVHALENEGLGLAFHDLEQRPRGGLHHFLDHRAAHRIHPGAGGRVGAAVLLVEYAVAVRG